jgi:hypothetical protein
MGAVRVQPLLPSSAKAVSRLIKRHGGRLLSSGQVTAHPDNGLRRGWRAIIPGRNSSVVRKSVQVYATAS